MDKRRIMVLGSDGYLGFPLTLRLIKRGHTVLGIDNLSTRRITSKIGEESIFPIPSPLARDKKLKELGDFSFKRADITKENVIKSAIEEFKPDTIVHFAEQRAAPYSMRGEEEAIYTMQNNIIGTMRLIYAVLSTDPDIHIVKMGTMGEYGTPNYQIPESAYIEITYKGRSDLMPVPKYAGSWYHWTKVHDSHNLLYAANLWGLKITDINQGPVYGSRTFDMILDNEVDKSLLTRYDAGETFGTIINLLAARASLSYLNYLKTKEKLPIYERNARTKRGYISLQDSINSLESLINNPPNENNFRVVNQFHEVLDSTYIRQKIQDFFIQNYDYRVPVAYLKENPRVEKSDHYYEPENSILKNLGVKFEYTFESALKDIINDVIRFGENRLLKYKDWIGVPKTGWRKNWKLEIEKIEY
ncbi:MAG: NAD-dependent epimerase/dehydratase family protein [Candidatus Rehaiarchaeum fermentans]|nr:NAD-dependent epimerase/dehydratase family protein [Candidatus Rehaiarchaeum fermentans]MCW1297418.1 NAD-dependent epimerase/dehydratase family protein [Candidatus Rehaiarchaeum fermentans]MCW1302475.1 NAD-dependent epimerase/dehydratase family protein [Candidatus Rehaiarchaeum fermentans]